MARIDRLLKGAPHFLGEVRRSWSIQILTLISESGSPGLTPLMILSGIVCHPPLYSRMQLLS